MTATNTKQTSEIHTHENEGFISDHYKDHDLKVQIIQKEKKKNLKIDISETKAVIKGSTMMD